MVRGRLEQMTLKSLYCRKSDPYRAPQPTLVTLVGATRRRQRGSVLRLDMFTDSLMFMQGLTVRSRFVTLDRLCLHGDCVTLKTSKHHSKMRSGACP